MIKNTNHFVMVYINLYTQFIELIELIWSDGFYTKSALPWVSDQNYTRSFFVQAIVNN